MDRFISKYDKDATFMLAATRDYFDRLIDDIKEARARRGAAPEKKD